MTRAVKLDESPDFLGAIQTMQQFSSDIDKRQWKQAGAKYIAGVWMGPDDKPCLPKHFFSAYAKLTHGLDHVSKGRMLKCMQNNWFTKGFSTVAQEYCSRCMICTTNNVGKGQTMKTVGHPSPDKPFSHVMIDYIQLTPSEGKKYCVVAVDMFSKWVEAMPTKHPDNKGVAKLLLQEIVPRWGIPGKISSDNGSHYVNQAISAIEEYLGVSWKHHCSFHPESSGAIERENQTLKAKLSKICEETNLSWTKALPIALTYMRMRQRESKSPPFEILFGRPSHMGWEPHNKRTLPDTLPCVKKTC